MSYGKDGDEACFYVLDARTVVGNCAMWWCPDGKGYTCNIDEAGLYTAKDVERMRETDIPVHRDVVERLIVRHVKIEHIRQAGLLDAYDKHKAERVEEEKRARRRARRHGEARS